MAKHNGRAMESEASTAPAWEQIQRDVDGITAGLDDGPREQLTTALTSVFDFVLQDVSDLRRMEQNKDRISKRVLCLLWSFSPSRLQNKSLHQIALDLDCPVPELSQLTSAARRKFHTKNNYTTHDWRNR